MLLNQTDVAVDEELEKVIITIYRHRGQRVGLRVLFRRNYRNLQWNRGVSTAWNSNAYCSECWNLAEITLFLMKFDEI